MYFEVYKSGIILKKWRWRLKAANHKIIAQGQGYKYKEDCTHCIKLIKNIGIINPNIEIKYIEFKNVKNLIKKEENYNESTRNPGTTSS